MYQTLVWYDSLNLHRGFSSKSFVPKTYVIDIYNEKFSPNEQEFLDANDTGIWILKPTKSWGGKGIKIIKNLLDFKYHFKYVKREGIFRKTEKKGSIFFVLQKYLEKPLLIQNKKFDLRVFVSIPIAKPCLAFMYEGFIRKTIVDYKSSSQNLLDGEYSDIQYDDNYAHITNVGQ